MPTGGAPAPSPAVKPRPAHDARCPSPGRTPARRCGRARWAHGPRPGPGGPRCSTVPCQPPSRSGTRVTKPAACTPGRALTRSSSSARNAARAVAGISCVGRDHVDDGDIGGIETGVDGVEALHRAGEHRRAGHQQHRQRDLDGDQQSVDPARCRRRRRRRSSAPGPGRAARRRAAPAPAPARRRTPTAIDSPSATAKSVQSTASVSSSPSASGRRPTSVWKPADRECRRRRTPASTDMTTDFGDDLADQPAAAGAEGGAQRQFLGAIGGAGQHQRGDVGAGDRQHQQHRRLQQQHRRTDRAHRVVAQRPHAGAAGLVPGLGVVEALAERARRSPGTSASRSAGGQPGPLAADEHQPAVVLVVVRLAGSSIERPPDAELRRREVEAARHHPDDFHRRAVDLEPPADHRGIAAQFLLPEAVAHDRDRRRARPVVAGRGTSRPISGGAPRTSNSSADAHRGDHRGALAVDLQRVALVRERGQPGEGALPLADEVELDAGPVVVAPEDLQARVVGHRQRPHQQAEHDARQRHGGADPERQRADAEQRVGRPAAELPQRDPQVAGRSSRQRSRSACAHPADQRIDQSIDRSTDRQIDHSIKRSRDHQMSCQ